MTALSPLIFGMKQCKNQVVPGFVQNVIFSTSQIHSFLSSQNRFISLAKDGETRTPLTRTNNNKLISGLKFSSIKVNGIRSKNFSYCLTLMFINLKL